MKKSLLFLRSFGDFTIALGVISKSKSTSSAYRLIASVHLEPLFHALTQHIPTLQLKVEFVDVGIRNKILGAFTNKFLINTESLSELRRLKDVVDELARDSEVMFEQSRRQWIIRILMPSQGCIHAHGNIYDSYSNHFNVDENELIFQAPSSSNRSQSKVIIFPESRKPTKQLGPATVDCLIRELKSEGKSPELAFYKTQPYSADAKVNLHDSFSDLLELIQSADEVVTADSLPGHLAQLMEKPHRVYYPRSIDSEWVTPYSKRNQTALVF